MLCIENFSYNIKVKFCGCDDMSVLSIKWLKREYREWDKLKNNFQGISSAMTLKTVKKHQFFVTYTLSNIVLSSSVWYFHYSMCFVIPSKSSLLVVIITSIQTSYCTLLLTTSCYIIYISIVLTRSRVRESILVVILTKNKILRIWSIFESPYPAQPMTYISQSPQNLSYTIIGLRGWR